MKKKRSKIFLGLCTDCIIRSPHEDDREVNPCLGDQLHDTISLCHSHKSLSLPVIEVAC